MRLSLPSCRCPPPPVCLQRAEEGRTHPAAADRGQRSEAGRGHLSPASASIVSGRIALMVEPGGIHIT
jgi:Cu-Zn family superoxide dismutase